MRFPKWSPDGAHLLSEDGHGTILLDGHIVVRGGWRPTWITATRWAFTVNNNGGTFEYGVNTLLHNDELHELAGGGGWLAGRASNGALIKRNMLDPSASWVVVHPNAGQPYLDRYGNIVYYDGQFFFEPTRLAEFRAWVEAGGVKTSWEQSFPGEGKPQIVFTEQHGNWLKTQTNWGLRLRQVGDAANGFEKVTGENLNLESDAIARGATIYVACNSGVYDFPLNAETMALGTPKPPIVVPPPPPPPPPEPIPMPTPPAVDLGAFSRRFLELVAGTNAADYRDVLKRIQPELWKFGAGAQMRSSGEPNSRLQLPHAGCRNVAPRPNNERELFLGVRQDTEEAWKATVDTVWPPNAPTEWVLHNQMGPAYLPLETGGDDGDPGDEDPQPPQPDLSGVIRRLDALEMVDKAFNAELAELADIGEKVADIARRLEQLTNRKYRVNLSRDWGHSHRGTVEVIE